MFSRVGVLREILTDQGSNFTSKLLTEVYKMLHIQPIRTSPYHPQTDGLVERFNQTLSPCCKGLPQRRVATGTNSFHMSCLHTGRFHKHPLDSLHLSWFMDRLYGTLGCSLGGIGSQSTQQRECSVICIVGSGKARQDVGVSPREST